MYIGVKQAWSSGVCRMGRYRLGVWCMETEAFDVFKVIKLDDFGSRGKMYKVELPYGDWVVWDLRGVVEISDSDWEGVAC